MNRPAQVWMYIEHEKITSYCVVAPISMRLLQVCMYAVSGHRSVRLQTCYFFLSKDLSAVYIIVIRSSSHPTPNDKHAFISCAHKGRTHDWGGPRLSTARRPIIYVCDQVLESASESLTSKDKHRKWGNFGVDGSSPCLILVNACVFARFPDAVANLIGKIGAFHVGLRLFSPCFPLTGLRVRHSLFLSRCWLILKHAASSA